MVGSAATLLLLVTLTGPGEREATAQLRVSARVVQSTAVTVGPGPGGPALHVRGSDGAIASVPLAGAARAGVSVAPHAREAGYVVVTVLLDAPLGEERVARAAGP